MTPDQFSMTWETLCRLHADRPAGTTVGLALRDLASGTTQQLDGEVDLPSASTIKVAIMIGLAQAVDAGTVRLEELRPTTGPGIRIDGSGVVNWLDPSLQLSLHDLAWLMIAISDNSTSNVLIETLGVEAINAAAQRLGAGGTRLGRKFIGSHDPMPPDGARNRATALGLVNLLSAIEQDRAASPARCAWMRQLLADQQHLDRIPRRLPAGVAYRGKTGSIERIAHDCGVLEGPGGKLALAVLCEGFDDDYAADAFIGRIGSAAGKLVSAG